MQTTYSLQATFTRGLQVPASKGLTKEEIAETIAAFLSLDGIGISTLEIKAEEPSA